MRELLSDTEEGIVTLLATESDLEIVKEDVGDASTSMKELARVFAKYVSKSKQVCWIILLLSIFTETLSTTVAKYASDLSSPSLLAASCALVLLSQCGLTASLAQIDVGIAYAMWAALGTATVTFVSFVLFDEAMDVQKGLFLLMIVVGVAGLHLREDQQD